MLPSYNQKSTIRIAGRNFIFNRKTMPPLPPSSSPYSFNSSPIEKTCLPFLLLIPLLLLILLILLLLLFFF
jgi:hypothetical protein